MVIVLAVVQTGYPYRYGADAQSYGLATSIFHKVSSVLYHVLF